MMTAVMALLAMPTFAARFDAYFANWAQYHSDQYKHTPADLANIAGRTDTIMYSFLYFCPPSGTTPMPYWAVAPFGSCTDDTEYQLITVESKDEAFIESMMSYQSNTTKIVASIGGWNFPSYYFSQMVASAESRSKFIASAKATLSKFKFSGIDIDWEFPCSPPRSAEVEITCSKFRTVSDLGGKCPDDSNNFATFLAELREGLGDEMIITVASQAGLTNAKNQGINAETSKLVDAWHIMTYDYTVPDTATGATISPNAPLYTPKSPGTTQMSIADTVQGYVALLHVPPEKIVIGIPFYGHGWFDPTMNAPSKGFGQNGTIQGKCCGVFKQTYGSKPGYASKQCGLMMYSEILAALGGGDDSSSIIFDNATKSDIVYFKDAGADGGYTEAGTFVSYAGPKSIDAIVAYSEKQRLGGVFIFDTSMDTVTKSGTWTFDLMNQIADSMNKPRPTPGPAPGPAGTPTCASAGQVALCQDACTSKCRGFQPAFQPGCVADTDCSDPPSWAKGSVCSC